MGRQDEPGCLVGARKVKSLTTYFTDQVLDLRMLARLLNPLHNLLETLLGFLAFKIYFAFALIFKDLGNCNALYWVPVFLIDFDAVNSDWSEGDLSRRSIESDSR